MPLPEQISRIIRSRIQSGEYRPGKQLGTVRQFARDFEVSPVTVIKALDILEEGTLIERVQGKGIFVTDRLKPEKKQLTACFAFPEKEMAPGIFTHEIWSLNHELYRGLFDCAREYRINLQFTYFEDDPSEAVLERQKNALRKFDFVIFPGHWQLLSLRRASATERPTFFMSSDESSAPDGIRVDYDRPHSRQSLLEYFQSTGCRTAAAIIERNTPTRRGRDFLDQAVRQGKGRVCALPAEVTLQYPSVLAEIKQLLRQEPEFVFVDCTEVMPQVFEAAYELGLTPGRDFIVTAIASGMTFSGMFPRFSYFRIPRYEMGVQLIRSADELVRGGTITGTIPELKVEFIEAQNHDLSKGEVSA